MDVVIECNQNFATKVYDNGNYVFPVVLSSPIFPGDTLIATKDIIDSQKSDANTIIIAEDTTGSMVYSFYDGDYDNENKKNTVTNAPWTTTYKYYAGYGSIQMKILISCQVNLPPGDGLFRIRVWFSYIDVNGQVQSDNVASQFGYSYFGLGQTPATYVDCGAERGQIVFRDGTLQLTRLEILTEGQPPIPDPRFYNPGGNNAPNQGPATNNLQLQKTDFVIPAGRYDPLEISQLITQQISNPQGVLAGPVNVNQLYVPTNSCLLNLQETVGQSLIWAEVTEAPPAFGAAAYKYIPDAGTGLYPYLFVGASLMAIQYGVTGQVFQWSYGYTPFYNAASPTTKNVALFVSGDPALGTQRYNLLTTATGITIHDLQPVSFWQSLGLHDGVTSPMITPLQTAPDGVTKYYTFNAWNVPEESESLGFFTPGYNREPPLPNPAQPTYYETDAIANNSILGSELISNPDGGYFLIKAEFGLATTPYYDSTDVIDSIVAVVSTQFNTANTVTGYEGDAIPYVHRGLPAVVSSITINILDPITKQTAPQLGPNNTVVFKLIRSNKFFNTLDASGDPVQEQLAYIA